MVVRLSTLVMAMMMVHVSDPAALRHVRGNILVILEGVLDMGADQRRDTGDLGQQQEPEKQRTETPKLRQREHLWLHQPLLRPNPKLNPDGNPCKRTKAPASSAVYRTDQAPRLARFDVEADRVDHRSAIRSSE